MTSQLLRIPVEIEISYKGKTIRAKGIVDTGAPGFLSIAENAVAPLGLNLYGGYKTGGYVEGATIQAWNADVDKISVVGNSDCSLNDVRIEVVRGSNTASGMESFLLGDDFLRSMNASVEYSEGGAKIVCHPKTVSMAPLLIGGSLLAVGITAAYLTWDRFNK